MAIRSFTIACAALALCLAAAAHAGAPLPIIVTSTLTGAPTGVPNTMVFPPTLVNTASGAQTETVTVHMSATQGGNPIAVPPFYTTSVSSVTVDDPAFAVTGGTCTTPPTNQGLNDTNTCTVALTFAPTTAGIHVASLFVTCFVAQAVGVTSIVCDNVQHRFIGLQASGVLAAVAAAVPALGNVSLTALALLLFGVSVMAMRRRR
jgi:hypothetical protein